MNELQKIMLSHKEQALEMYLPIFLGYDESNQPIVVDLTKVGHILIGGNSGQGKTNLLHAFAQSVYYSPRQVFEGCFVSYFDPKGIGGPRPYFDSYRTAIEDIRNELKMLCNKIEKRMNNPKLFRYPLMVLCDDFDSLVMYEQRFMDMLLYIAERGHLVGIYLVAASIPISWKVFPGLLKANIPTRICFRVTDKSQSRLVLDSPDATQLSHQGEMFFSHNLQLTRVQTVNVTEETGE